MRDTQRSEIISTQLRQIAAQAIEHPERVFTSLIHRMDVDFLREAYYRLRKDGAPGLSGVTAKAYGKELEANLIDLHERLKAQRYIAPLIKRVWLEQGRRKETTDRDIGDRRQDRPESGIDAHGGGLRAGFLFVLLWISGGAQCSPSDRRNPSAVHEAGHPMDIRCGHQWVFRQH